MKQEDEKTVTMSFSEIEVVGVSSPLSERPILDGCQSYTNKTLSASLQRNEAKAESKSYEGDDSPTSNDRSLGSNDAYIDPHPATLPPTNTIGHIDWKNGEFVAQRNADVGFAQAPIVSDQTIEQTFNRPTKISGSIIGVSGSREVVADSTPSCSAETLLSKASQCWPQLWTPPRGVPHNPPKNRQDIDGGPSRRYHMTCSSSDI